MSTPASYSDGFDAVSDSEWRDLVEKTLKGKPFDKVMKARSYDNIEIEALYTPENVRSDAQPNVRSGSWHIDTGHWNPDAKATNAAILDDLERGATSITLKTQAGHFPGIKASEFAIALDGVFLNLAPVNLIPGEAFAETVDSYLKYLGQSDIKCTEIKGCLGVDPIGVLAKTGRLLTSLDESVSAAVILSKEVAGKYPNLRTNSVDTSAYHLAGATEAQELGVMLSTLASYLRAFENACVAPADAVDQIEISLAVDADIYLNIAKFRSARRLIASLLKACGVEGKTIPINAVSSLRMMTVKDPWVNILRATSACFAAGVGGADRISILPHDSLIGMSSRFARRIARNVQIILQEESSLAVVADPAAGSFAFETLTTDLSEKAWEYFQKIEKSGDVKSAIVNNTIQSDIEAEWQERMKNIAKRKDAITGVSEFPDIHEKPIDNTGDTPDFIEIVADAGEETTPLPFHRLSESFEYLRSLSDAELESTDKRPQIFLANLGSVAAHTARATFAKNFFEAGGIEALSNAGFSNTADLGASYIESRAKAAVICGSDADYEALGAEVAKALKAAGCEYLYLAGKPANMDELRGAGVDDFIFLGCDVLGTLEDLMKKLNAGEEK
ncbi:methylmalonyl-CoA mutase family protein [Kordiimonas sp. SCSIO 12610]|uniref:methylmalonyl-CoA mutase family protein n=1 Tax=Kordiimonas sp. SCSIO 12610 TaxID=2829597 RepID=UPI00210C992C|nr:methylmalonyl-CoA mutase family protein [Kordiimonas sp. SCSIO 12610]UTW54104.1 methylmalonyl-CoA mutase small subunit [Kordiimonas sp. SCSIO 12610]